MQKITNECVFFLNGHETVGPGIEFVHVLVCKEREVSEALSQSHLSGETAVWWVIVE